MRACLRTGLSRHRNASLSGPLARMAIYYFDFRVDEILSPDEDGVELPDAGSAHKEALGALAEAIRDAVLEGQSEQRLVVSVRDELGPVLQISAVVGSTILRKQ